MLEGIFDWASEHKFASVFFGGLILLVGLYGLLSMAHAIPWFGFDGRWHSEQVCHLEPQEIIETTTSDTTYTYYDDKGRSHTGTRSTTIYHHTGRYHDVPVCHYE